MSPPELAKLYVEPKFVESIFTDIHDWASRGLDDKASRNYPGWTRADFQSIVDVFGCQGWEFAIRKAESLAEHYGTGLHLPDLLRRSIPFVAPIITVEDRSELPGPSQTVYTNTTPRPLDSQSPFVSVRYAQVTWHVRGLDASGCRIITDSTRLVTPIPRVREAILRVFREYWDVSLVPETPRA